MSVPGRTISTSLVADQHASAEVCALVDTLPLTIAPAERDGLKLALSELVVTSVPERSVAAHDRIDVQFTLHSEGLRCEVAGAQRGSGLEQRPARAPGPGGLVHVDRIASRWGTLRHGRGVWFELDLPPRRAR